MEQIRHKLIAFEGQAKPSKAKSVMKWWSRCISMVIAKTASRSVAFKAARLGDSTFDRQSETLMTEDVTVNSSSHEEDFDDVGCNADLYAASNQLRGTVSAVGASVGSKCLPKHKYEVHTSYDTSSWCFHATCILPTHYVHRHYQVGT